LKLKQILALVVLILVPVISLSGLPGIFRALLIWSSLLLVPLSWILLRGEKYGDPEGGYPDPSTRPPRIDFGEFQEDGPLTDLPAYGPSKSSAGYRTTYLMQREWVHPDWLRLRESWQRKRKRAEEKREQVE
jgi:hypothetical protein